VRDTFQKQIATKSVEIDTEKLHMEFSAFERRLRRYKTRFSRFKETCAWGHQRAVPP